jgi:hypothetical protein
MDSLAHKDYTLPEVDLSHDEGDPRWHAAGGELITPNYNAQGKIIHYTWTGRHPGHYREYWALCVVTPWEETVRAYEASPEDAFSAWTYVDAHPVFWRFDPSRHAGYPVNHVSCLTADGALLRGWPEITPHRICPATRRHEDDEALNTETEWWCELGPEKLLPDENGRRVPTHDYLLDCGGATYEDAVIALARTIHDHYGNDRAIVDSDAWLHPVLPLSENLPDDDSTTP